MAISKNQTPHGKLKEKEESFGKLKGGKLPTEMWFQNSNEEWDKLSVSWESLDSSLIEYRLLNLERIRKFSKKDFQLTIEGESIWEIIRRNLELEKESFFWIPKNGSIEEKHIELIRCLNWLLNKTADKRNDASFYLPDEDLYILVIERLLASINHLRIHYLRDKYSLDLFQELKGKPRERINSISKIFAACGLERLMALFKDLENHNMISVGSANLIYDHFKEDLLDESGSIEEDLILWISKKYEFVYMIRKLRAKDWLKIMDSQIKEHFAVKGKSSNIKHFSIKDTDDLEKIKKILAKHDL